MRRFPMDSLPVMTKSLANVGDDFTPFFSQSHGTDPSRTFFRKVG
jgi:hypothetical protein